jgi:hypothetical protein
MVVVNRHQPPERPAKSTLNAMLVPASHCPRWTLKSVSAPPPAARSSCPPCRVRRGRMRSEGQDGWLVLLVEGRPLTAICADFYATS